MKKKILSIALLVILLAPTAQAATLGSLFLPSLIPPFASHTISTLIVLLLGVPSADEIRPLIEQINPEELKLEGEPQNYVDQKKPLYKPADLVVGKISASWQAAKDLREARGNCLRFSPQTNNPSQDELRRLSVATRFCAKRRLIPAFAAFNKTYADAAASAINLIEDDYRSKYLANDLTSLGNYTGPLDHCISESRQLALMMDKSRDGAPVCEWAKVNGGPAAGAVGFYCMQMRVPKPSLMEAYTAILGSNKDALAFKLIRFHQGCMQIYDEEENRVARNFKNFRGTVLPVTRQHRDSYKLKGYCDLTEEDVNLILDNNPDKPPEVVNFEIAANLEKASPTPSVACSQLDSHTSRLELTLAQYEAHATLGKQISAVQEYWALYNQISAAEQTLTSTINQLTSVAEKNTKSKIRDAKAAKGLVNPGIYGRHIALAEDAFEQADEYHLKMYAEAIRHCNEILLHADPPSSEKSREEQVEEALSAHADDLPLGKEEDAYDAAEDMDPEDAEEMYDCILNGGCAGMGGIQNQLEGEYGCLDDAHLQLSNMLLLLEVSSVPPAENKFADYEQYFPLGILDYDLAAGHLLEIKEDYDSLLPALESQIKSSLPEIYLAFLSSPAAPPEVFANKPARLTHEFSFTNMLHFNLEAATVTISLPHPPHTRITDSSIISESEISAGQSGDKTALLLLPEIAAGEDLAFTLEYDSIIATSQPADCRADVTGKSATWDCTIAYQTDLSGFYKIYLPFPQPLGEYLNSLDGYAPYFRIEGGAHVWTYPGGGWSEAFSVDNPISVHTEDAVVPEGGSARINSAVTITSHLPFATPAKVAVAAPYSQISGITSDAPAELSDEEIILSLQLLPYENRTVSLSYLVSDLSTAAEDLLDYLTGEDEGDYADELEEAEDLLDSGNYDEAVEALLDIKQNLETSSNSSAADSVTNLVGQASDRISEFEVISQIMGGELSGTLSSMDADLQKAEGALASKDYTTAERLANKILQRTYDHSELQSRMGEKKAEIGAQLSRLDKFRFALLSLGIENKQFANQTEELNNIFSDFQSAMLANDHPAIISSLQLYEQKHADLIKLANTIASEYLPAQNISSRIERIAEVKEQLTQLDLSPLKTHLPDLLRDWAEKEGKLVDVESFEQRRQYALSSLGEYEAQLRQLASAEPIDQIILLQSLSEATAPAESLLSDVQSEIDSQQRLAKQLLDDSGSALSSGLLKKEAGTLLSEGEKSYMTGRFLDAYLYAEYAGRMKAEKLSRLPLYFSLSTMAILVALFLCRNKIKSALKPKLSKMGKIERRLKFPQ